MKKCKLFIIFDIILSLNGKNMKKKEKLSKMLMYSIKLSLIKLNNFNWSLYASLRTK